MHSTPLRVATGIQKIPQKAWLSVSGGYTLHHCRPPYSYVHQVIEAGDPGISCSESSLSPEHWWHWGCHLNWSRAFPVFARFETPTSMYTVERCLLCPPLWHGWPTIFPGCPPPPTGRPLHLHPTVQCNQWPGQASTHLVSPWWPHRGVPPTQNRDWVGDDVALFLQHAHLGP